MMARFMQNVNGLNGPRNVWRGSEGGGVKMEKKTTRLYTLPPVVNGWPEAEKRLWRDRPMDGPSNQSTDTASSRVVWVIRQNMR